jgi:NAD(P)-dependent dehydrogenase (short-subunit alcohol dehydrogenase family)
MELRAGQTAVVTGAASGIGHALAEAFARRGLNLVLADVQDDALAAADEKIRALGVETLPIRVDVSKEEAVQGLATATLDRFGGVHVVCNNAGVGGAGDPWFGPLSSWEWVLGVNLWGVVHGVRAFLPHLVGGGHIVNTASIAGLYPGFAPPYDASKHAVVAITESLYNAMTSAGLPVGVSCLCPGWVRTGIVDSDRNWPAEFGERPQIDPVQEVSRTHVRRAIDEGTTPAAVADLVLSSVEANRFWVFPHDDFLELCVRRWERIAEKLDPDPPEHTPGMPPRSQIVAETMAAMERMMAAGASGGDGSV